MGFWAAKQKDDIHWPAAALCGVGASLDYTVNKGFIVVLLLGYESSQSAEDLGDSLRRRPDSAVSAAARRRAQKEDNARWADARPAGPRVMGVGDLRREPPR